MTWIEALRAELGDRVRTEAAELAAVARDASHVMGHPEALLYPETTEHVATAVRIARSYGVAIVPRGGGTALTGATVSTRGGLVIAFNKMKSILDLDLEEGPVDPFSITLGILAFMVAKFVTAPKSSHAVSLVRTRAR